MQGSANGSSKFILDSSELIKLTSSLILKILYIATTLVATIGDPKPTLSWNKSEGIS